MKSAFISILFFSSVAAAQNVGIGTTSPLDPLHVNGFIRSNGLRVTNNNYIELGYGLPDKQADNGKIALNAFGEANTLSIVGGGIAADGSDRKIKLWANGGTHMLGNVGIWTLPGTHSLTINSNTGANLSLQNFSNNAAGVQTNILFGGSNYSTAAIRAIGINSNAARLGFFTGFSFQGGVLNLQERVTIANNGYVGIGNTNPQQALDINGMIRFSGNTPAAFKLTAKGTIMCNDVFMIDSSERNTRYIRLDHPFCNNNPGAIILATPIANSVPVGVQYRETDGFWYLAHYQRQTITGFSRYQIPTACNAACAFLDITSISSIIFTKDSSEWNILILSN